MIGMLLDKNSRTERLSVYHLCTLKKQQQSPQRIIRQQTSLLMYRAAKKYAPIS